MNNKTHKFTLTVRYFETDQMKVVYYSHYLVWFEAARTDMLKKNGLPYSKLEKMGYFLPVSEVFCKYLSPAYYEDEIIIETYIDEIKNASLKIAYIVKRKNDNTLLAKGYTVHPCINHQRKIVPIPETLKKILK